MTSLAPIPRPMSFTERALLAGEASHILNPPNEGQDLANILLGKPARAVARLVYQVSILAIIPFGVAYHLAMAMNHNTSGMNSRNPNPLRHETLAWHHFKAGLTDLTALPVRTLFFLFPNQSISTDTGNSFVNLMDTLSPDLMPISFVGQALFKGATSDLLNPPNKDQGVANILLGKPLRAVARLVYQLSIVALAPFGVVYHEAMALYYSCLATKFDDQKPLLNEALAWHHFKAGLNDLHALITQTEFFLRPIQSVNAYTSNSLVEPGSATNNDNSTTIADRFANWDQIIKAAKTENSNKLRNGILTRTNNIAKTQMKENRFRYHELIFGVMIQREYQAKCMPFSSPEVQGWCRLRAEKGFY